jgi:hypothetical protein
MWPLTGDTEGNVADLKFFEGMKTFDINNARGGENRELGLAAKTL